MDSWLIIKIMYSTGLNRNNSFAINYLAVEVKMVTLMKLYPVEVVVTGNISPCIFY